MKALIKYEFSKNGFGIVMNDILRWRQILLQIICEIIISLLLDDWLYQSGGVPFFLTVGNFIVLKAMSDILYMLWYCQLLGLSDFLAHRLSSDKGSSAPASQGEMELRDLGAVLNPPICHLCLWELTQNRLSKCSKPRVAHTKAPEKLQVKPRCFFLFALWAFSVAGRLFLLQAQEFRCTAFSSCGIQAFELWHSGLLAL